MCFPAVYGVGNFFSSWRLPSLWTAWIAWGPHGWRCHFARWRCTGLHLVRVQSLPPSVPHVRRSLHHPHPARRPALRPNHMSNSATPQICSGGHPACRIRRHLADRTTKPNRRDDLASTSDNPAGSRAIQQPRMAAATNGAPQYSRNRLERWSSSFSLCSRSKLKLELQRGEDGELLG